MLGSFAGFAAPNRMDVEEICRLGLLLPLLLLTISRTNAYIEGSRRTGKRPGPVVAAQLEMVTNDVHRKCQGCPKLRRGR